MARPTSTPGWDGSSNETEPGAGQKTSGWTAGQKPPSTFANWFWGLVSDWIDYLDTKTNGEFELRISPKIKVGAPLAAGARLSPADWVVIQNNWTNGSGNSIETNSGAASHDLSYDGLPAMLANRVIGPDDKIQIVSIKCRIDKSTSGNFTVSVQENDDAGAGGMPSTLMSLSFSGTTSGFELKTETNGGVPVDFDLNERQSIEVNATPSSGVLKIAEVIITCQVVPA